MVTYLVELYLPAPHGKRQIDAARAARDIDGPVRYLRSIFLPEEETCFHEYESTDVQTLSEALRRAGVAYERLIRAEVMQ